DELTHLFPRAEDVAGLSVNDIAARGGIISARAGAIVALAEAVLRGDLRLEPGVDVERTIEALDALPGIGPWTAHYIAMRALAWPDAFPHPDVAVLKAMREQDPARVLARAAAWQPWRSYVVMHLWKSLEEA